MNSEQLDNKNNSSQEMPKRIKNISKKRRAKLLANNSQAEVKPDKKELSPLKQKMDSIKFDEDDENYDVNAKIF